jgi:hypothetical protein
MVARDGLEPPTCGFSVAGTVDPEFRKPKNGHTLTAGARPPRLRPNLFRSVLSRLRRCDAYPNAAQRIADAATERGPTGRVDGMFMPHDQSPMADVLAGKVSGIYDAEVHIERSDRSRVVVIMNIAPLIDGKRIIVGAAGSFCENPLRQRSNKGA